MTAYREFRAPPVLRPLVACLWENAPVADHRQRIVPDGCVDLIWLADGSLIWAGADTGPRTVTLPAGATSSGVRLRPGAAGAVLGLPASEIRDRHVPAELVWGAGAERLSSALAAAEPLRRLELLAGAIARRGAEPDAVVRAAAGALSRPGARVARVADALGLSERQLNRRLGASVGYGPKVLARVARLRRLIACDDGSLAARAFSAGYASQAHMTDEVRRLTGLTPVRFLEDAALTAA